MAKGEARSNQIDPTWPGSADDHAVGAARSDRQGSLSPFGEESFPVAAEKIVYEHPVTVVNR